MQYSKPKRIIFAGCSLKILKAFGEGNETEVVSSVSFMNTISPRFMPDLIVTGISSVYDIREIRSSPLLKNIPVLVCGENFQQLSNLSSLVSFPSVLMCNECVALKKEFITRLNRVLEKKEKFSGAKTGSVVKYALLYMNKNVNKKLSRGDIAKHLGVNESYLSRIFKQEMGISLWNYLNIFRLSLASKTLEESLAGIKEVALMYGFESDSYFIKAFKKEFGVSPGKFRLS